MKKSLLTLITFALVLVNLVLTAVMALTIVPEVKNVNGLISKISESIDLDIQSGNEKTGGSMLSIDSIEPWSITDNMTINLKRGEDGKDHFAIVKVTFSKNMKSDAYENYSDLGTYEDVLKGEINKIVSAYTMEELSADTKGVLEEIKNNVNSIFGSDLIADVTFASINYQ